MAKLTKIDEMRLMSTSKFISQKEYWLEKLAGEIPGTELLLDERSAQSIPAGPRSEIPVEFPAETCERLIALSKKSDLSLYIVLLSVLKALIYRYTGSEDITTVSPLYKSNISNDTINDYLLIRDAVDGQMSYKDLLIAVKQSVVKAYERQDYPFARLLEQLDPGETGAEAYTNTRCVLDNIHVPLNSDDQARQDHPETLVFSFNRREQTVAGTLSFDPAVYQDRDIRQFVRHYVALVNLLIFDINACIGTVDYLSPDDRELILHTFNDNQADFPRDHSIYHCVERFALESPGREAIVYKDVRLTYSQLNRYANRLARVLRQNGVGPDRLVGVLMDRSHLMAIGILAVWKAGGAYIPLSLADPEQRTIEIMNDSKACVLLTGDGPGAPPQDQIPGAAIIPVPSDEIEPQENNFDQNLDLDLDMNTLAYVIYTSGSTGKPKGAMIEHIGMMNHMQSKVDELQLTGGSIVAQNASHTFDISVWQYFVAFINGGKTIVYPNEWVLEPRFFVDRVIEDLVTILEVVPSYLSVMLDAIDGTPELPVIYLLVTGETVKCDLVRRWFEKYPHIPVVNAYGPTEASDDITHHIMHDVPTLPRVPIGHPVQNLDIFILDPQMGLCPVKVKGEIYVSGVGVGRGYLGDEAKTAAAFSVDPFKEGQNVRMYKTGDVGRWLPDGTVEFFGRKDYQVKIRGFRIELGEIESKIVNHDHVREAIVLDHEDHASNKYLCGYVVLTPDAASRVSGGEDFAYLKEHLAAQVPDYMVPAYIIGLDRMPLTPNGKVDRKALPEPDTTGAEEAYAAPRDEVEEKLTEIWSGILGMEKENVSVTANFFDLGGQSLRATVLISQVHRTFGVKIPLPDIFKMPTVAGQGLYIKNAKSETYVSIEPVEKAAHYPLSSAQKRLYILQHMETETTLYNIPGAVTFDFTDEPRNREKLDNVFQQLIQRHDSLRTSFTLADSQPVQVVHDHVSFDVQYIDADGDGSADDIIRQFIRPFDLSQAPLLRVAIISREGGKTVLAADMHHIVSDGLSHDILMKEFLTLYHDRELAPLRIQYKDYSSWQNKEKGSAHLKAQENYWLGVFQGDIPVLELPADYVRPAVQQFEGKELHGVVGPQETRALKELAAEHDVTLYMMVLAVFNVFLYRITGSRDIILGTPVAGRSHADLQDIIGMFVNTLALRNNPGPGLTFPAFLKEVKTATLEAFENQEYQFEDLVEKLSLRRDAGRNPLFDVIFTLQNQDLEPQTGGHDGQDAREMEFFPIENRVAKFDMIFTAVDRGDDLEIGIDYSVRLFKEETVTLFIQQFKQVLSAVLLNPNQPLSHIELITTQEKETILRQFNDTAVDYPHDQSIHQLFQQQAAATPHALALTVQDHALTYGALDQLSTRLAAVLQEKGVLPGDIAGIMAQSSVEMMIGLLAILKAGAVYLPVNPGYPQPRKLYMLNDGNTRILLVDSREPGTPETVGPARVYSIPELLSIPGSPAYTPVPSTSRDLAYVLYTSGSTGTPKGVLIEHRSVVRLVKNTDFVQLKDDDRILQTGALEFDASTFEIWGALLNGLVLYLAPKDHIVAADTLEHIIKSRRVSTIWMTSPLFNRMLQAGPGIFSTLRNLVVGGDVLSPVHIGNVTKAHPSLNVINGYGPTENTTFSATYPIPAGFDPARDKIPVGRPIANSTAYILDSNLRLQPVNVAGELCVGGHGVARGYLNDPRLTASKFIPAPFLPAQSASETILYRTGDLARWMSDNSGNIEFLGRIDQQVKIRGFRVETGEIETRLLSPQTHSFNIKEAVVVPMTDASGEKYLSGYIVSPEPVPVQQLRQALASCLPDYMIPSYFVQLDKIPLTVNGKVDRKALPVPAGDTQQAYTAPRDEVEETLAHIWEEVLTADNKNGSPIGIDHDFFDLGGHSLKATLLVARVHRELGIKIPLVEIFTYPTIRGMAEYIESNREPKHFEAVPLAEEKEFYILSTAQRRLYALQQMAPNRTGYNIPHFLLLEGDIQPGKIHDAFIQLIRRHESLRTIFQVVDDVPVQRILEPGDVHFAVEQYPDIENISRFVRPFDLACAPLFRAALFALEPGRAVLGLDIHHIISDGVSDQLLVNEFMAVYAGQDLPGLTLQYRDYAQWEHNWKASPAYVRQETFWRDVYRDNAPSADLPLDYARPAVQRFDGNNIEFTLDAGIAAPLKTLAADTGATLFMVLLSAYMVLLSRLTREDDLVVGSPVAARRHSDLNGIIGMFVNMVALRGQPKGGITFNAFLNQIKNHTLQAFEHQEYPFEDLVEHVVEQRDTGRHPIFDTVFVMQNVDMPELQLEGLTLKSYPYNNTTAKFDMTLVALETGNGLAFRLEYNTTLFNEKTVQRFIQYFKRILTHVGQEPGVNIEDIPVMPAEEKQRIVEVFNGTQARYPEDATINSLFRQQVKQEPGRVAVSFKDSAITYRELDLRASRLARQLRDSGVKPGEIVGLLTDRSLELITGVLGILKAGGAYMPIDPDYPVERITYMLADSGARVLVADVPGVQPLLDTLTAHSSAFIVDLSSAGSPLSIENAGTEPLEDEPVSPSQTAYVIYTSGSTGKPKGVMIEHRNVVRLMVNDRFQFDFGPSDTWTMFHSHCFDFSVWEMYGALLYGGQVIVIPKMMARDPREFLQFIDRRCVTVLNQTPSAFYQLSAEEAQMPGSSLHLRYIIFGGEALNPARLEEFKRRWPHTVLVNMFGITETTVHVTYKEIGMPEIERKASNIGTPIPTLSAYILDDRLQLLPFGVKGELCVGGDGVARGYLNRPELTAQRFVDHPFTPGQRLYRSGDYARQYADGEMEYLGRMDQQVQLRGFRVEPGEIENRLLSHDSVKEAVVTFGTGNSGTDYLCAYVVPVDELGVDVLRKHLSAVLPDYMIPAYFVSLDRIPLTSNNKTDFKALPKPDETETAREAYVAPENPVQEKMAEVWAQVLGLDRVGIRDNFFTIGGDSIKAIKLLHQTNKALDTDLTVPDLYQSETVEKLSARIEADSTAGESEAGSLEDIEQELRDLKQEYMSRDSLTGPVEDVFPMSDIERGMVFASLLNPGEAVFHDQFIYQVSFDQFDTALFRGAFALLVQKHSILRTSFHMGDPCGDLQVIHPEVPVETGHEDISHLAPPVQKTHIKTFLADQRREPFAVDVPPLWRLKTFDRGNGRIVITWQFHHAILDGWSNAAFMTELSHTYNALKTGSQYRPQPLTASYRDFITRHLFASRRPRVREYWTQELDGYKRLELAHLPGARGAGSGLRVHRPVLPVGLSDDLTRAAQQLQTGIKHICFAAYAGAVSLFSYDNDVVIGLVTNNRPVIDGGDALLGCFLNTVPVRVAVPSGGQWIPYLRAVDAKLTQLKQYDMLSLFEIARLMGETADERDPFFDTIFNFIDFHIYGDAHLEKNQPQDANDFLALDSYENTRSPLNVTVSMTMGRMDIICSYNPALIAAETVERLGNYFVRVLETCSQNPEGSYSPLDIMSPLEKEQLLARFNVAPSTPPVSKDRTVVQLFRQQVQRTPDAPAVFIPAHAPCIDEKRIYTYQELDRMANAIAHRLIDRGITQETITGIAGERSVHLIAGLLGILKAGAAYLPVDPQYPVERIRYMLEDSRAPLVLTVGPQCLPAEVAGMCDIMDLTAVDTPGMDQPPVSIDAGGLAYIIYTSGSTGVPKGVMVEHHSLVNYVLWGTGTYLTPMTPDPTAGQLVFPFYTTISFDLTVTSIYLPLVSGNALGIYPDTGDTLPIEDVAAGDEVDIIKATPTHLKLLLMPETGEDNGESRTKALVVGGEELETSLARDVNRRLGGDTAIYNEYGPTEATVGCMIHQYDEHRDVQPAVSIGRPIDNARIYLLDNHMNPVAPGAVGEICVGGGVLARGYLNQPEMTAQRFVEFDRFPGGNDHPAPGRLYRTGDLGKWESDARMTFKGRIDHQVKIRGYRVETGEIQEHVLQYPGIGEAVVTACEDANRDHVLAAYIVSGGTVDIAALKDFLNGKLPNYMIPSYFMQIPAIPVTPGGKLDTAALPAPELETAGTRIAPAGEIEHKLAALWSQILGIPAEQIGAQTGFFDLGGHSLNLMTLISAIHREFNVKVPLSRVFQIPTIKQLAAFIQTAEQVRHCPVEPVEAREYYPLSSAQERLYVVYRMNPNATTYNNTQIVSLDMEIEPDRFQEVFCQLVARHESFRTAFMMADGVPAQYILPPGDVEFNVEFNEADPDTAMSRIDEFVRPFDLTRPPLLRVSLTRTSGSQYVLMIDMHHIISDAVSMAVFIKEFMTFYRGGTLAPLPVQYKDYAVWQADEEHRPELERQENFWLGQFEGGVPVLNLPTDFTRPKLQDPEGGRVKGEAGKETLEALNALAKEEGATLYMVLLAIYNVFLARVSGQQDIVVGSVAAGRRHSDLDNVMGMFVNTLALRNFPANESTFREFLRDVKERTLAAFEHQDYQFEDLVKKIVLDRDPGRNPIFDVIFDFQNVDMPEEEMNALNVVPYDYEHNTAMFDMNLIAIEAPEQLLLEIEYSVRLFTRETQERWISWIVNITNEVAANPGIKLIDIEMVKLDSPTGEPGTEPAASGERSQDEDVVFNF